MKYAAAPLVLVAGIAAAVALTLPSMAKAWDWQSLPTGYFVSNYTTTCNTATDPCVHGNGSTCNHLTVGTNGVAGTFSETDCVNPGFQSDLDAFVGSTICAVNPSAGGQACAPATTSTTASTTSATITTTTTTTASAPAPVTTTTAAASADPAPVVVPAQVVTVTTPTSTETVTVPAVTTPSVPSSVSEAISLLQQQIMVLEGRVQAIEQHLGFIVGEEKNELPFTAPA